MKSKWITHKNASILYADYANLGRDINALREEVDAVDEVLIKVPDSLLLVDIRNTVTSSEVVALMKASAVRTRGIVARTAVVGVSGIQRVLAQAVARFSREPLVLFNSIDDAKEWLAGGKLEGHEIRPE
jgi:hypothetical protein